MSGSASAPPEKDEEVPQPGDESEDDLEMTSIMDAEQRRELQRAARKEAERQKEPERETARPPPEVSAAIEQEAVAIPKAAKVPSEAPKAEESSSTKAGARDPARAHPVIRSSETARPLFDTVTIVAFVLLAAAVAYALRG